MIFVVVTGGMLLAIQAIGVDNIRDFIEDAGPLAPLAFILVKILTYVAAPLTSGPIQLSAGIFFGLLPGTIYTLIGEVIGGSIAFWISRRFGRSVVKQLVGDGGLERVDNFIAQIVDWKTLLYARIFLFSFYDFISYAVGFSKLPFRTYLIISTVAGFFPTFAFALIGSTVAGDAGALLPIYGLVGVLCILPLIFQKQIRRFFKMDTPPKQENVPG